MQAHHTLMVKVEGEGEEAKIVDHKTIPNNEWAKYRKGGWQFATTEQLAEYNVMLVEQAADAAEEKRLKKAEDETEKGDGPLVTKDDKKPAKAKSS